MTWHDHPFRKTHDLKVLGRLCAGLDPTLEDIGVKAGELTKYAFRFRYPGEPEEPTLEEAQAMLELATSVYRKVRERLPEEAWD